MKKQLITIALASLVTSSMQIASYAQQSTPTSTSPAQTTEQFRHHEGGWMGHGDHWNHHKDMLKKKLNLTPDQEKQAKLLREQSRCQMKPIIEQMKAEREKIEGLKQANASPDQIKTEQEKYKCLKDQAIQIQKQNHEKFESILNPQQKAKFKQMKKEMKKHRESCCHKGHWNNGNNNQAPLK